MKVRDVIEQIRLSTATQNDLTGKSANQLVSNKNLVFQLKNAKDTYASETLAIESIYSIPVDINTKYAESPPLALRSKTYSNAFAWVNGLIFPISIPAWQDILSQFPYQTSSSPRFVATWSDKLYFYPNDVSSYNSTELAADINLDATEITVDSVAGFPPAGGRITIGEEKISYQYIEANTFKRCTRGVEDTTPVNHSVNEIVKENNFQFFYYKLPFDIPVNQYDAISPEILNKEMEICDEHLHIIISYTVYKLLLVIDRVRANDYKIDWDTWLHKAKNYIASGRNKMSRSRQIKKPYYWESSNYFSGYFNGPYS